MLGIPRKEFLRTQRFTWRETNLFNNETSNCEFESPTPTPATLAMRLKLEYLGFFTLLVD